MLHDLSGGSLSTSAPHALDPLFRSPEDVSKTFGMRQGASVSSTVLHAGHYFPTDVSSRFGARLRELRKERNFTQLQMAIDFGIDRSYISDIERGRKSVSLPTLEVIAIGMHLSLSDLLHDL